MHKNKWKFQNEGRLNGVYQKRQWFVSKDWWCLQENIHLYWHTHKHVGNDIQESKILIMKGLTVGSALWVKRRKFLSKQWEQIEHCMNFCEGRWEETNSQGSVDIHLFYGADASSLNQPALRPCWFLGSLEPNSIQHEEAVGADLTCHSFAFLSFSLPEQTLDYWGFVLFYFVWFFLGALETPGLPSWLSKLPHQTPFIFYLFIYFALTSVMNAFCFLRQECYWFAQGGPV